MSVSLHKWLAAEAVSYVIAALVHSGVIVSGYKHTEATIAESSIAVTLAAAWLVAGIRPQWLRPAALWGQGLALFWTLVGLLVIVLGVGPRTIPDILYHVAIVSALIYGLIMARGNATGNHDNPRHTNSASSNAAARLPRRGT